MISGRVLFHEGESSANVSHIAEVRKHDLIDKATEIRGARSISRREGAIRDIARIED
jgi:hypothetical protein